MEEVKQSNRLVIKTANTEQVQNRRILITLLLIHTQQYWGNLVLLSVLASGRKSRNLESLS